MRSARISLLLTIVLLAALAANAAAERSDNTIIVIRATAIAGLADYDGPVRETRERAYTREDDGYAIDGTALASLDGVQALLLVDSRRDLVRDGALTRRHAQDVRPLRGVSFEIEDVPGKLLTYQLATVDGRLGLLGDGDVIYSPGGAHEPYFIWRIDGIERLDRGDVRLR
ncbi:MAG: hypothetical protein JXB04_04015 [Kiritimatiellae bacterium]|nr:hypothetical protein [Kiritimatiellia bacterium]